MGVTAPDARRCPPPKRIIFNSRRLETSKNGAAGRGGAGRGGAGRRCGRGGAVNGVSRDTSFALTTKRPTPITSPVLLRKKKSQVLANSLALPDVPRNKLRSPQQISAHALEKKRTRSFQIISLRDPLNEVKVVYSLGTYFLSRFRFCL